MGWGTIVALAIGVFVFLVPVAFIGYINVGGISAAVRKKRLARLVEKAMPAVVCSTDTDCPEGYVCMRGRCVPEGTS